MIKIENARYFFIRDHQNEGGVLAGHILELTYIDTFSLTSFKGIIKSPGISGEIVSAIGQELLENKKNWF